MRSLAEIITIAATTGVVEDQITDEEEARLDALAKLLGKMDLDSVKAAFEDAWKYRDLSK